jgi:hypothetical protein
MERLRGAETDVPAAVGRMAPWGDEIRKCERRKRRAAGCRQSLNQSKRGASNHGRHPANAQSGAAFALATRLS